MSDVNALIGKLKANVAYRRFSAPSSENGQSWPVLERIAQAQKGEGAAEAPDETRTVAEAPEASAAAPQAAPPPQAAAPKPAAPVLRQPLAASPAPAQSPPAAPPHASTSPLLRRIQAQAAPAQAAEPPTFSALASAAEPEMTAAPEPVLQPQPPLQPDVDAAPEPARGLLLQRYAPAAEAAPEAPPPQEAKPGALSNIFAQLERKTR